MAKTKRAEPRYKTVVLGERTLRVLHVHGTHYQSEIPEGVIHLYFNEKIDKPKHLVEVEFISLSGAFEGGGATLREAVAAINKDMLEAVHTIGGLMGYEFEE